MVTVPLAEFLKNLQIQELRAGAFTTYLADPAQVLFDPFKPYREVPLGIITVYLQQNPGSAATLREQLVHPDRFDQTVRSWYNSMPCAEDLQHRQSEIRQALEHPSHLAHILESLLAIEELALDPNAPELPPPVPTPNLCWGNTTFLRIEVVIYLSTFAGVSGLWYHGLHYYYHTAAESKTPARQDASIPYVLTKDELTSPRYPLSMSASADAQRISVRSLALDYDRAVKRILIDNLHVPANPLCERFAPRDRILLQESLDQEDEEYLLLLHEQGHQLLRHSSEEHLDTSPLLKELVAEAHSCEVITSERSPRRLRAAKEMDVLVRGAGSDNAAGISVAAVLSKAYREKDPRKFLYEKIELVEELLASGERALDVYRQVLLS